MMQIVKLEAAGGNMAIVKGDEILISDVQSALDLMATVRYETDSDRMILHQSVIHESFFDLSTRLAGDILQKFINYQMKVAIVGDFTGYTSKSLRDFIYECNHGKDIFFFPTEQEAVEKLSSL
jgi:hypothetical protein